MTDKLITFAEAAELVGRGVTVRTLRTWHEEGRLEAQRVGRAWRTTAGKLAEAVEKGWQGSPSTAQTASMAPAPSRACGVTSGISPGTKDAGDASVARATSLAIALGRSKRLAASSSAGRSSPSAPVIPLK